MVLRCLRGFLVGTLLCREVAASRWEGHPTQWLAREIFRTQKNLFEILLNRPEIRLYFPFSDWFGTKRRSVWFHHSIVPIFMYRLFISDFYLLFLLYYIFLSQNTEDQMSGAMGPDTVPMLRSQEKQERSRTVLTLGENQLLLASLEDTFI